MSDIKFYMQKCSKQGVLVDGTLKDLEQDFDGLKYMEAKGISKVGKVKNAYIEQYADSNILSQTVCWEFMNNTTMNRDNRTVKKMCTESEKKKC